MTTCICKHCGTDCTALEHNRKHNKAIWLARIKYHDVPPHLRKDGALWYADTESCFRCHEKLTGANKKRGKGKLEKRTPASRSQSTKRH